MKLGHSNEVIHKDVVIIGNGPSGIALSYMLSGNIPFVVSNNHPDEFLSARLTKVLNKSLINQDIPYLAQGLEGRTTNPVSLLLDALQHPCADIGLEIEPLIEWRKEGKEIDHIVLGKGPPGGSWHTMDPHILTLSLGTWMALPGLPYQSRDGVEKRALAANVANYYSNYVKEMKLENNFRNGVIVTKVKRMDQEEKYCCNNWVEKIDNDFSERIKYCSRPEPEAMEINLCPPVKEKTCFLTNALSNIILKAQRKYRTDRCCKRRVENVPRNEIVKKTDILHERFPDIFKLFDSKCLSEENYFKFNRNSNRSISLSYDLDSKKDCDGVYSKSYNDKQKLSLKDDFNTCFNCKPNLTRKKLRANWIIETYDLKTKSMTTYTCNSLVLATGSSDIPNRLQLSEVQEDPTWLLHDLRSLEIELDLYLQQNPSNQSPVLIVGAGLSAADAVIATRARNIPVIHVFRNKTADFGKQLPENMYPEYHKVHQMMQDGGSTYPLYTALPEYKLTSVSTNSRTVILTSSTGKVEELEVSFAVVLIGSRPNLSFLPEEFDLGVKKQEPIDCKNNTVDINKLNHEVKRFENLYALGPLAGDNFVRFLPGGALAITKDLYKKYEK